VTNAFRQQSFHAKTRAHALSLFASDILLRARRRAINSLFCLRNGNGRPKRRRQHLPPVAACSLNRPLKPYRDENRNGPKLEIRQESRR